MICILLLTSVFTLNVNAIKIIKNDNETKPKYTDSSLTEGNFLYVGGQGPNNYSLIQEAIDNTSIKLS